MRIATTVPTQDPAGSGRLFADLEAAGYDSGFSFESKHDPFLPLALASNTTTDLRLGTAVAIAFARNPMVLANIGSDLQRITGGRFVLGLGSQVRPHIEKRFSETWSRPAARMRELVLAIRAIWDRWEGNSELAFDGEFYRHTLMAPAFDPGPNPFGPPSVFLGGFGPRMIRTAGEVADGLIVHPFNSRRSLEQIVQPAVAEGAAAVGRSVEQIELVWATMVVTWTTEAEHDTAMRSVKDQLSFYGSTPAYAAVLELHGLGDLHAELNQMSKTGRWSEMGALIPDSFVHEIAVVGERRSIAAQLVERAAGITDSISLVNNRNPDPGNFSDIVSDLRSIT